MAAEVTWTEAAIGDLEHAIRTIAWRDAHAAESFRDRIREMAGALAHMPYIGPIYERAEGGRIREVICVPYRLFYRVSEDGSAVEILRLWHGARSEPRF